jgi:Uma2 family endonuclease
MIATVDAIKRVWTEPELEALAEDGFIHEVVNGDLVMSPKNDFFHGDICTRLCFELEAYNREHKLGGVVLDSSTGFWMQNQNCRAPDVSYVTKARLQALQFSRRTRRFFPGAPDLAIEILSPNQTRAEIDERLKDFFASGTQIAWIINAESETVEVCHSLIQRKLIGAGGFLEGEQLLPGFRHAIADLFKESD